MDLPGVSSSRSCQWLIGGLIFVSPMHHIGSASAQSVVSIGVLPSGTVSIPKGVSDGGFMAAMVDADGASRGARWAMASGFVQVGFLPGSTSSDALGISANGQVVVGYASTGSSQSAYRWSATSGTQALLNPYSGRSSWAMSTSADGSVIVGAIALPDGTYRAARWAAGGTVQVLGTISGGSFVFAWANGVSPNGLRAVGYSSAFGSTRAAMWSVPGTGAQNLGALQGATASYATGVSGTEPCAVVGYCSFESSGSRGFRWTPSGGMRDLGVPSGFDRSTSLAVSSDGVVVVGRVGSAATDAAAIWHPTIGMTPLTDYLASRGLALRQGIALDAAVAISPNGRFIAVQGRVDGAQQGLLVDLANPCWTDLNRDRVTDGADLAELLSQWGPGGSADFDASGSVDGADLGVFLNSWGPCGSGGA